MFLAEFAGRQMRCRNAPMGVVGSAMGDIESHKSGGVFPLEG